MTTTPLATLMGRAGVVVMLAVSSVFAQQPGSEPGAGDADATVPLSTFLDLNVLALDADLQALVPELLAADTESGAASYAKSRTYEYVTLHDAVLRALKRNLTVAITGLEAERLSQVFAEAEAVFDPVFDISTTFRRTEQNERKIFGEVIEKAFRPRSPIDIETSPRKTAAGIPQINQLGFRAQDRRQIKKDITVNESDENEAKKIGALSVGVSQQLPWGPTLSVATVTTHDEVFYDGRGNSYGKNWTASLALDMAIPAPWSRNFGRYAPQDVSLRLAFTDGERAYWDLQTAINAILVTTEASYWDVVGALENLRVVADNRKLVQQQVEATERLYKAELVTRYGKSQIDAELARVAAAEESARRNLLVASTRLASLITDTRDAVGGVVLLPVDYTKHLGNALDLEANDAFATAAQHRPELRAAALQVERADINRRFAKAQTRPDLNLVAGLDAKQKGDPIGYNGLWEALGHVTEPDIRDFDINITYIRPWANRAFKARHVAAVNAHQGEQLGLRDLENIVEQSVGDALADLHTARSRVEAAQKNVEFAQDAYDRLLRRRASSGDVPELQVVLNSQRLLEARANRIGALVAHKVAEAQLLSAQGIIAHQYGQRLATNDFERYRIGLLAANDALRIFKPLRY